MKRYYTLGAVVPDLRALGDLDGRLEEAGVDPASLLVFSRRGDGGAVSVSLPEANVRSAEAALRRIQYFEFASVYIGVTAVSVLMAAVHLPTGIVVQSVMTLAAIVGLILYRGRPRLKRKVTALGLPDELAGRWEESFPSGFALILVTVPEELFEEAQNAFQEDPSLIEPLAIDRRVVF
ncbi:MAG: hypothetical protein ACRDSJ_05185 [Rubrobacteraceae bacterium]